MESESGDVRSDVDAFMSQWKRVDEFSLWNLDHRSGEQIIVAPVTLAGEIVGRFELNAYPREPQPSFRLLVIFMELCVSRFDWREADGPHYNSLDAPVDAGVGPFYEPHYHSWDDNRRFARYNSLPDRLRNARSVPANVRSFEASLRWFCGDCNIDIAGVVLPILPPRDRLL